MNFTALLTFLIFLSIAKATSTSTAHDVATASPSFVPRIFAIRGGTSDPTFEGDVEAKWLVHGHHDRDMKLIKPFTFVDKNGRKWTAPRNFEVDGASIPRPLWATFGSPYVGDFRRASVVHDYFCKPEHHDGATSEEVHRMFYDAMLCDGVNPLKAWAMYQGVRVGGPRWS